MGIELPFHPDDDNDETEMPPELEVRISQLAAQASQVLLQRDRNEIAAQQAQQAQQDPIVQMQQQELQIKAQDSAIKKQKVLTDAAAKADQLQIERERIQSMERIAGLNAQVKVTQDDKNRRAKQEEAGVRMGIDVAKTKHQFNMQSKQQDKPKEKNKE